MASIQAQASLQCDCMYYRDRATPTIAKVQSSKERACRSSWPSNWHCSCCIRIFPASPKRMRMVDILSAHSDELLSCFNHHVSCVRKWCQKWAWHKEFRALTQFKHPPTVWTAILRFHDVFLTLFLPIGAFTQARQGLMSRASVMKWEKSYNADRSAHAHQKQCKWVCGAVRAPENARMRI